MTNELSVNLSIMYKLMKNYSITTIDDVKENLFCIKCKKLLTESCQIGCGCKFCRDCLHLLIKDDFKHCPGITEYCENMDLLKFNEDFGTNIEISKLKVKCPEAICSYQCELIKMFEHIRLCENKSINCPLVEFGCKYEKNTFDKINEHIQMNSYDHIKFLTDILENMRNEITEMKNSDQLNKIEIENLKSNFREELEQIRIDNEKQNQNNKVFMDNLLTEIDRLNLCFNNFKQEMKHENQIQLESITNLLNNQITEVKSHINGSIYKIEQKLNDLSKNVFNRLEMKSDNCCKPFDERIVKLENKLEKQFDGIFQWKIYENDSRYKIDDWIWSGYFYGRTNPYKMQLIYLKHENGWRFRLRVYYTEIDRDLKWPFRENITLRITNECSKKTCEKILKLHEIEKPVRNPYNISYPLEFSKIELLSIGLWDSKWFIVECLVG